jgi:DNA primase
MIAHKSIEEVLSTAKVEEVIDDFVTLKKRGSTLTGLCPFHDEKTPSFVVSPSKGIYKCFGCGKAGTAVGFVMEHESLSYVEAIRYLANRYKIELVETEATQGEIEAKQMQDSLYIVNEFASKYYQDKMFDTDEGKSVGLSYFKERGFLESTIKKFGLGYAPSSRDEFTRHAVLKKYNLEHLKILGLTTKNDYDFFTSRVMFSIHNLSGKIVALAGRIMSQDKNQPKYINSPESEIYIKHKTLYGLYQAKTAIRRENECILVEGYTDVISLHQGGIENVVASSGTALNKEQIKLIKRFTDNIKLVYDGDPAGIKAAMRGLDLILEEDVNIRLVLLPDKEDPDSFYQKNGTEKFKQYLIDNEKDFIIFKTDYLLQFVGNDPIKRVEVFKEVIESIAKVRDDLKRFTYINLCSQLMKMDEQVVIDEVGRVMKRYDKESRQNQERERQRAIRQKQNDDPSFPTAEVQVIDENEIAIIPTSPKTIVEEDEYQEKDLVRILVAGGDKMYDEAKNISIAQYLISNLEDSMDMINNSHYKSIITLGANQLALHGSLSANFFINHPDISVAQTAIDMIATPYVLAKWEEKNIFLQTQKSPEENYHRDAYQAILRFKMKKITKTIEIISKDLNADTNISDDDKKMEIKVLTQLIKERNDIANMLSNVIL